jgi:hypothetical protein
MKAGLVKVLRKVDFKIPRNPDEANQVNYLIQDPTTEEYDSGNVESKLLEVD